MVHIQGTVTPTKKKTQTRKENMLEDLLQDIVPLCITALQVARDVPQYPFKGCALRQALGLCEWCHCTGCQSKGGTECSLLVLLAYAETLAQLCCPSPSLRIKTKQTGEVEAEPLSHAAGAWAGACRQCAV